LKKELKIKLIENDGNSLVIDCEVNEGVFETMISEIDGTEYQNFKRTLIKEFSIYLDEAPSNIEELENLAIDLACENYGYLKEEFVNGI